MDRDSEHKCPICGGTFKRSEMDFTYDCHGIPFRLVCMECWDKQMRGANGYDGEYYTPWEENIYDY